MLQLQCTFYIVLVEVLHVTVTVYILYCFGCSSSCYSNSMHFILLYREKNSISPIKFTYTAMHGVGYPYVLEACKPFGFKEPIPVVEQVIKLHIFLTCI